MLFAEELSVLEIGRAEISEIKRLIGQCVKSVKKSHIAEAIARGFGYNTNAALVADLKANTTLNLTPDRQRFEAFLSSTNYDVEFIQVSLLPDAVRLATNTELAAGTSNMFARCISCEDDFESFGRHNRVCGACKLREGRTLGINHVKSVSGTILHHVFLHDDDPMIWYYLNGRPGWTDFFASREFNDQVASARSARVATQQGNLDAIPHHYIEKYFKTFGYYMVMDELEVPRKTAERYLKHWANRPNFSDANPELHKMAIEAIHGRFKKPYRTKRNEDW